jgi:hypothetical protein
MRQFRILPTTLSLTILKESFIKRLPFLCVYPFYVSATSKSKYGKDKLGMPETKLC